MIYLAERSTYYQRLFLENAIDISQIETLEDLSNIPTTSKDDLQTYNDDFLCVPKLEIVEYVTTSGTLGQPVSYAMTEADLERLGYNEAISLACAGISKEDTIQLMTTVDRRFMAGLAYVLGTRKLGAAMVRVGNGIPQLQWDSILRFKPSCVIAVPSFLLKLIDFAENNGIDYKNCSVKKAICIGEPIRQQNFNLNTLGNQIHNKWAIELFSTYASTEMATAFTECERHRGGHTHPELIITELLDDNGQAVEEGKDGELTITTLGIEAMPLLRFRTGDILRMDKNLCDCGRSTSRVGPLLGRRQHMLKLKGTTIYPTAIEDALKAFKGIDHYLIELSYDHHGNDKVKVLVATKSNQTLDLIDIVNQLQSRLRVKPDVEQIDYQGLSSMISLASGRKPKKILDLRDDHKKNP